MRPMLRVLLCSSLVGLATTLRVGCPAPHVGALTRPAALARALAAGRHGSRPVMAAGGDAPDPAPVAEAATEKMKKSVSNVVEQLGTLRVGRASPDMLDRVQARARPARTPRAHAPRARPARTSRAHGDGPRETAKRSRAPRSPRAHPRPQVDYYGAPTPLNQLASVSTPGSNQLVVDVYDKGAIGDVERALIESDLGEHNNSHNNSRNNSRNGSSRDDSRRRHHGSHSSNRHSSCHQHRSHRRHHSSHHHTTGMMPNNDGTVIRLNVPELTKDRRKVPVVVLSACCCGSAGPPRTGRRRRARCCCCGRAVVLTAPPLLLSQEMAKTAKSLGEDGKVARRYTRDVFEMYPRCARDVPEI